MKLRATIGWASLILSYFVLGGMEQELIDLYLGIRICVVLFALFVWGGIPWHKKF